MHSHILRCLIATAIAGITAGSLLITETFCDPIPVQHQSYVPKAEEQTETGTESSSSDLPKSESSIESPVVDGYILRLSGNTLYVFEEGTVEPLESYDLESGWLPDYDRILLEYGMHVTSKADLHALIEDYTS
ncbi:MAG: hypothetical protein IKM30_08440 [Oscillospiraceae bacterium]|nr:hypothetical protein [Oscillospiraceae bacterium]